MHGSEVAFVTTRANETHAFSLSSSRWTKTPNVYINTALIFSFLRRLFNSFSCLCKGVQSLALPIAVEGYESLNINDWEWLMDPPTCRPPQTDRNSDRHMHLSCSFLAPLSPSLTHAVSVSPTHSLIHSVTHLYTHENMLILNKL